MFANDKQTCVAPSQEGPGAITLDVATPNDDNTDDIYDDDEMDDVQDPKLQPYISIWEKRVTEEALEMRIAKALENAENEDNIIAFYSFGIPADLLMFWNKEMWIVVHNSRVELMNNFRSATMETSGRGKRKRRDREHIDV